MKRIRSVESVSTIIADDASFEGELNFSGTLRVDGQVKGSIASAQGTVIIGEKAKVEGVLNVGIAVIHGEVTGSVDAVTRIEVYTPGKIEGDIRAPIISIDTGVIFNGHCEMTARTIASDKKKVANSTESNPNIESFPKTG
jgi:cytoskeletal protein CcmA (bactofilin family)